MRPLYLLFLALASCTLLARRIDPCVDKNPRPNQICAIEGASLQTRGNVLKMKVANIDGVLSTETTQSPDIVMLTEDAGSLRLEAILGPTYNTVIDLSAQLEIVPGSLLDFDLGDVSENEDLNHEQVIALTATHVLIFDVPSTDSPLRAEIPIDGEGAPLSLSLLNRTISGENPRAVNVGGFVPTFLNSSFRGREIAVAYTDVSSTTPEQAAFAVFNVDVLNPDNGGGLLFISQEMSGVADILEMESHNINGATNSAADEPMLITTTATGEVDAFLFISAGDNELPSTRLRVATQFGGVQFVDINDDSILEILAGDPITNTVELNVLQSINDSSPVKNEAASQSFVIPGAPQSVSLIRLSDGSELILAGTDGRVEVAHRKTNDEIELINDIPGVTTTGTMLGFDSNNNDTEEMYIPNTNKEIQIFIPNFR